MTLALFYVEGGLLWIGRGTGEIAARADGDGDPAAPGAGLSEGPLPPEVAGAVEGRAG
jgi:hypothetical protein